MIVSSLFKVYVMALSFLLNDISSLTGFCSSLSPFKLNSLGIVKQCAHPFSSVGYAISGNPIQPTNIYLPSGAFVVCGA